MEMVLEWRSVMNLQFILNKFYMKVYTAKVKLQWLWVFLLYHFVMCTSWLDFFLSLIFTAVWANTVSEVMTMLFETECIRNSIIEHMLQIIACDLLSYNNSIMIWRAWSIRLTRSGYYN